MPRFKEMFLKTSRMNQTIGFNNITKLNVKYYDKQNVFNQFYQKLPIFSNYFTKLITPGPGSDSARIGRRPKPVSESLILEVGLGRQLHQPT